MATEIHATAVISPAAQLGQNVKVGPFCVVKDNAVIGDDTILDANVIVHRDTFLGARCKVAPFASIGGDPQALKYKGEQVFAKIGDDCIIKEAVTINRGTPDSSGVTTIGNKCMLMATCHVAHDCQIGNEVVIANAVGLAGHVTIGNYANIGGLTAVHQFVRIGEYAYVGGFSAVPQDVPPYVLAADRGGPEFLHGLNKIGLKRRGFSDETLAALKQCYRYFFRSGLTVDAAVQRIKAEVDQLPQVVHFIEFMEATGRGIGR